MKTASRWFANPSKQDCTTPQDIFDNLHKHFHFTVDACASAENAKLPKYWTVEDSCLDHDWSQERVFCNPPFSKLPKYILPKARTAEFALIILMLNQLSSNFVHNSPPDAILIPNGRPKFGYLEGSCPNPTFGVAYLVYGKSVPIEKHLCYNLSIIKV